MHNGDFKKLLVTTNRRQHASNLEEEIIYHLNSFFFFNSPAMLDKSLHIPQLLKMMLTILWKLLLIL